MKYLLMLLVLVSSVYTKTLIFGVVPQQSPKKLTKTWAPFIKYLSDKTGCDIVFRTQNSIPKFEDELYKGSYDIAYSNPYHYVIAHDKQNHNAVVRFNKKIVGILVVKKNSKLNNLKDLKGKHFLFPAPKAFAATLLPKYEIKNTINYDIDKSKELKYVNSHDSVYLGIQRGFGDVGGGIMRTFNRFKGNDSLKILYKTKAYPSHPISISQNLDKETINKIKEALLSMPKSISDSISKKGLKNTSNAEYDVVKELAKELKIL